MSELDYLIDLGGVGVDRPTEDEIEAEEARLEAEALGDDA